MTVVLIKSKLLNLMASGEGSAPQRRGLLLRDRNSLAYGAERGRGDSQKIADTVLSIDLLFRVCSFFANRYQTSGQEVCVDSLWNNLNLLRDGPGQHEAHRVS